MGLLTPENKHRKISFSFIVLFTAIAMVSTFYIGLSDHFEIQRNVESFWKETIIVSLISIVALGFILWEEGMMPYSTWFFYFFGNGVIFYLLLGQFFVDVFESGQGRYEIYAVLFSVMAYFSLQRFFALDTQGNERLIRWAYIKNHAIIPLITIILYSLLGPSFEGPAWEYSFVVGSFVFAGGMVAYLVERPVYRALSRKSSIWAMVLFWVLATIEMLLALAWGMFNAWLGSIG